MLKKMTKKESSMGYEERKAYLPPECGYYCIWICGMMGQDNVWNGFDIDFT